MQVIEWRQNGWKSKFIETSAEAVTCWYDQVQCMPEENGKTWKAHKSHFKWNSHPCPSSTTDILYHRKCYQNDTSKSNLRHVTPSSLPGVVSFIPTDRGTVPPLAVRILTLESKKRGPVPPFAGENFDLNNQETEDLSSIWGENCDLVNQETGDMSSLSGWELWP